MTNTLLLYGSESGMTEDIADQVSYKLLHHRIEHTLSSFDTLNLQKYAPLFKSGAVKNIIVISSTAGQGELPLNIKTSILWEYFKASELDFSQTNFYFLGVGDSLYLKFQHGIQILKLRICDRFNGIFKFIMEIDVTGMKGDGATEQVLPAFINALVKELGNGSDYVSDEVYISKGVTISTKNDENKEILTSTIHETKKQWFESEIMVNERITSKEYFSEIRRVVFKNTDDRHHEAGDTISIRPHNDDASIDKFFELQPHLKQYRYQKVIVKDEDSVSEELFEDILRYEVDFRSVPKRNFFMKLWNFQSLPNERITVPIMEDLNLPIPTQSSSTTDLSQNDELTTLNSHKTKLFEFGHASDAYDFIEYVTQSRRSILEILYDFEYIKIPFSYILQILPIIRERQYSLSADNLTTPHFEITLKVLEYETLLLEKRKGFCSNYIKNLPLKQKVLVKLNQLDLSGKLEDSVINGSESIILIGPGVGIAPIKAFCDMDGYLDFEKFVYFGNRKREMDYIHQTFWEQKNRQDMKVRACFSRDGEKEKYVQDMLWNDRELIYELVKEKNAIVYVCGSAGQMPTQVKLTFIEIMKTCGDGEKEEGYAERYVNEMIKSNRYIQETW